MNPGFSLHLMRHGAPVGAGRLIGHSDCNPLPEGIALCRERARGLVFATLIASDLARARLAAAAIGADRAMPVTPDRRWRELDFGAWEGLAPADLPHNALGKLHHDPDAHAPPGGECWSALVARVADALDAITHDCLVVCHAGAIRAALSRLLNLTYPQTWAIALPYAACVSLRVWPDAPRSAQITGLVA